MVTPSPTILEALATWSAWHADVSPLGATGDYALDMMLADAFRALLYRPCLNDRLDWLGREVARRGQPHVYRAQMIRWWLDLHEAVVLPPIDQRTVIERNALCASL